MTTPLETSNYVVGCLKELPMSKWVMRTSRVPDFAMGVFLHWYRNYMTDRRSAVGELRLAIQTDPVARNALFLNMVALVYRYPEILTLSIPDYILAINVGTIVYALADPPTYRFLFSRWLPSVAITFLGVTTYLFALQKVFGLVFLMELLKAALLTLAGKRSSQIPINRNDPSPPSRSKFKLPSLFSRRKKNTNINRNSAVKRNNKNGLENEQRGNKKKGLFSSPSKLFRRARSSKQQSPPENPIAVKPVTSIYDNRGKENHPWLRKSAFSW